MKLKLDFNYDSSRFPLSIEVGIPLLLELAHHLGLTEDIDNLPGLWERQGTYTSSDYVMGAALTLIAGGEGLDDTRGAAR